MLICSFILDGKKASANPNVAIVTSEELRDIRGKAEKNSVNNAAIITKAELDRIKAETVIKSVAEIKAERKMLNAQKEQMFMDNTRRKERMKGFDNTRTSKMPGQDVKKQVAQPDNLLSKAME